MQIVSQLDHQLKREKNRLEAMMEHLYPTTVKLSTTENNNNKKDASSHGNASNEKETDRKGSEHTKVDNAKNSSASTNERHLEMTPNQKNVESSSPKTVKSSSSLVSPLVKKTSYQNTMDPLPPHTIIEPLISRPESISMDVDRSNSSSRNAHEKQNIVDMEARMQHERTKLLEGYNTLNNITRMREDQVHFYFIADRIFLFYSIICATYLRF